MKNEKWKMENGKKKKKKKENPSIVEYPLQIVW